MDAGVVSPLAHPSDGAAHRVNAARPALANGARAAVIAAIEAFTAWLQRHGETSHDHQSWFAGPWGGRAKALYYRRPRLGVVAVAPMIAGEALWPRTRRWFWKPQRFPIADAHYAMGHALLFQATGDIRWRVRARHFVQVLEGTRSGGDRPGWGYPFDWVTRTGTMTAGTPLITSTPYVYEAVALLDEIDPQPRWQVLLRAIAEHALRDIPERELAPGVACCGYHPDDPVGGVVNAAAYRAFLLSSAAARFGRDDFGQAARRNLAYVLGAQQADGSWPYATDGVRGFIDHFHTCFVLKALAKIERLGRGGPACSAAIDAGVRYYVRHLFDDRGLPRPFAVAPRLTVYRQELYDYAECLNLGALLAGRDAELDARTAATLDDLLLRWQRPDGSFRSRRLMFGWDEVPMHRWAQSQIFRSLCLQLCPPPVAADADPPHP